MLDDWETAQPKVFGIGLSKTGTTSLAAALRYLGYYTLHYQRNGRILSMGDLRHVDAAVDTPVAAEMETLARTYPNARFIYTTRHATEWVASCKDFFAALTPRMDQQNVRAGRYYEGRAPDYNFGRTVQVRSSLYWQCNSWREAYGRHHRRVCDLMHRFGPERFFELNICGGDGWPSLCDFLGHEVPDCRFPHMNEDGANATPA